MARLRIQWTKSAIGYSQKQRRVLRALGFRRLNQVIVHEDSPTMRGMVQKVRHLVRIDIEAEP